MPNPVERIEALILGPIIRQGCGYLSELVSSHKTGKNGSVLNNIIVDDFLDALRGSLFHGELL